MSSRTGLLWRQVHWQQPLEPDRVMALLRQWATDGQSPRLVLETSCGGGQVAYRVGGSTAALRRASALIPQVLPGAYIRPADDRPLVQAAGQLKASTRQRPLHIDQALPVTRAVLAALIRAREGEELVIQVILGPRRVPLAIPTNSPSSVTAPVWDIIWHGNGGTVDSDKRRALRLKVSDHGFACVIRLGVSAATPERRRSLLGGILAALRTSEAPGVQLRLAGLGPSRINNAQAPWFWPLRLNVQELAGLLAWPLSDDLPGQPVPHPKRLPPAPGVLGATRTIARADAPGIVGDLALPMAAALHHLHVIGPTGVGKSTLLAQLVLQDIADGRGVVVIEPKGDLVDDVLARIPGARRDDVVLLDPLDTTPVGLNPLSRPAGGMSRGANQSPDLAADRLLSLFRQLYGAAIGARSADVLYAGIATLCRKSDTSLIMLPLLLTNPGFRRSLTATLNDPLFLGSFWAAYDSWSDGERANVIAPVMNKLRPLLRPQLRAVLGQRRPRFDISQVLEERKILLVPLRRGLIGPEAASLIGSLVVAQLWQATLARAAVPATRRSPVSVVIDEVQDYLRLDSDIGEALAQARGFGVGFTLAHQYLGQLPSELQAAILTNARSRVCFQLGSKDAAVLSSGHPEIEPLDLTALGSYEIYASLFAGGAVTPYASGRTSPLPTATTATEAIRRASRERYGRPLDEVEAEFAELIAGPRQGTDAPLGRRRRPS